jgi:hypothetical protein
MHVDAMYLFANPHREYRPISEYSVDLPRPVPAVPRVDNGDGGDDDNNNNHNNGGDWDDIDTGNVFASFVMGDLVTS